MKTTKTGGAIPQPEKHHEPAPRLCATEGCAGPVSGKEVYCKKCRHLHQLKAQREYRERTRYYDDPLPFGQPTSLAWLAKFNGWAKSGISYADYQLTQRQ